MAYEPNDYDSMNHLPSNPPSRSANGMASQPRNGFNNQKDNGVPVPGAGPYYRNGSENNPMMQGPPLFDIARSPPSGPNKSESFSIQSLGPANASRHQARPMQVLQARNLPGR